MLEREATEKDAVAVALLKEVKTYRFISTLCLLRDVLEPLMKCCKSFQKDIIDVEETSTMLQTTLDVISILPDNPGPHSTRLTTTLEEEGSYQTISFHPTDSQKQETVNTSRKFVDSLMKETRK